MDIAKPPDGFFVIEPAGVKAAIDAYSNTSPRILVFWDDIKSRLKQTGHREGTRVNGPPGARLYVAEGDEANGLPTIKVAYTVLGDTLRIRAVMVSAPNSIW
jgi:hypothetical protein